MPSLNHLPAATWAQAERVVFWPERLVLAASLGLALLAAAVSFQDYDTDLLLSIYGGAATNWVRFWRAVSLVGSNVFLTPAVLCLTLLLVSRRRAMEGLWLLAGWGMTSVTVEWLKWLVDRERPSVPSLSMARGNAFPSGHAADSLYVFLYLLFVVSGAVAGPGSRSSGLEKVLLPLLAVLPFAVGYSRVYLGVHWPSDVLGGWALGLLFLGIALLATRRQGSRAEPFSASAPLPEPPFPEP